MVAISKYAAEEIVGLCDDPLNLIHVCWPHVRLYDKQAEILYSVRDNDETVVPAGNMLGKDFIGGLVTLWFFLTRYPCRVVTTSAGDDHLRVLWGEIGRFISTSKIPLLIKDGGILKLNHYELKKLDKDGKGLCDISYVKGMVASEDNIAKLQGHHANPPTLEEALASVPRSLFISDESSSVKHQYYTMASTWAKRRFIFGNTWECNNFFKYAVKGQPGTNDKGGDIPRDEADLTQGYHRKIIKIKAEDSPNVRRGRALLKANPKITRRKLLELSTILPGVITFGEYEDRRKLWDPVRQAVSLDADFYEDAGNLLFPPQWLNEAETYASSLKYPRPGVTMGVDPAEGGDNTVWTVADYDGIIEQVVKRTRDTSVIAGETLRLMHKYQLKDTDILFDNGGGGKQHVDYLRAKGHKVRGVGFGEAVDKEKKRVSPGMKAAREKEAKEEKYVYKNRRAQMYGIFSNLLDPMLDDHNQRTAKLFAIPAKFVALRHQLAPLPRKYDGEGRLYLPPKNKPSKDSKVETLRELLGCSPDEADSTVLAIFGLFNRQVKKLVGAA